MPILLNLRRRLVVRFSFIHIIRRKSNSSYMSFRLLLTELIYLRIKLL